MTKLQKPVLAAFLVAALASVGVNALAQEGRDFPLPEGLVTDFTGTLTEAEIEEIEEALRTAYDRNGMDGHVIIALRTEEWHLEEYAKDYADFLQGRNLIEPTGWLIYVSTADRKFALVVQDVARESITTLRRQEIALIMSQHLEEGNFADGIVAATTAIGELDAVNIVQERRKVSPDMLIFMGIVVIVIVLMLRLRRAQTKP